MPNWCGWNDLPFDRFKGLVVSRKYPIVVAWGKCKMKENFSPAPLWSGNLEEKDDGEEGVWRIKKENLEDWKKYCSLPITKEILEDEEICQDYYKFLIHLL